MLNTEGIYYYFIYFLFIYIILNYWKNIKLIIKDIFLKKIFWKTISIYTNFKIQYDKYFKKTGIEYVYYKINNQSLSKTTNSDYNVVEIVDNDKSIIYYANKEFNNQLEINKNLIGATLNVVYKDNYSINPIDCINILQNLIDLKISTLDLSYLILYKSNLRTDGIMTCTIETLDNNLNDKKYYYILDNKNDIFDSSKH